MVHGSSLVSLHNVGSIATSGHTPYTFARAARDVDGAFSEHGSSNSRQRRRWLVKLDAGLCRLSLTIRAACSRVEPALC